MNCVKKKKTDLYERIISQIKISVFLIFSKKCSYSRLYKEEGDREEGMKKEKYIFDTNARGHLLREKNISIIYNMIGQEEKNESYW